MEPPRVYIETTIPSAYFDTRTAPEMIRRREATRRWWADAEERYELVTSITVLEELERGPAPKAPLWLGLLDGFRLLDEESSIADITAAYVRNKLMPSDPAADALHLALASSHSCDFLLTWNYKHLANANKFGHIQRINTRLGLFVPRIVTPLDLLEVDHERG
jgi:predicted nucleic acid-binding protein